jgi:hypothetical protein
VNAGTYSASAHFASSDANYNDADSAVSASLTINKAHPTLTTSGGTFTYDGATHASVGSAKGVDGTTNVAGSFAYTYTPPGGSTTPMNASPTPYAVSAAFTSADPNYDNGTPATNSITINQASSTTTVTFENGPYTYRGSAFTATAAVTGVGGLSASVTPVVYTGDCLNVTAANGCTATATFAGDTNHTGSMDHKSITITQASSTTTLTCPTAPQIYTGSPQTPCTASYTTSDGLHGSPTVSYTNNTNPGMAGASASYAGDSNHAGSSNTGSFNITFGVCSASVGSGGVILPPINSDGTSVYQRKGGSTIPVKFRVCAASGASISNPAAVFAGTGGTLTMLSAVRGTIDNVNEVTGTDIPDVAFRWDASGQQWIFNMATTNLTSGSTYAFRINLAYSPASITFVIGVK